MRPTRDQRDREAHMTRVLEPAAIRGDRLERRCCGDSVRALLDGDLRRLALSVDRPDGEEPRNPREWSAQPHNKLVWRIGRWQPDRDQPTRRLPLDAGSQPDALFGTAELRATQDKPASAGGRASKM